MRIRTPAGEVVWVQVLPSRHGVRLGFDAPDATEIFREELLLPSERYGATERAPAGDATTAATGDEVAGGSASAGVSGES